MSYYIEQNGIKYVSQPVLYLCWRRKASLSG